MMMVAVALQVRRLPATFEVAGSIPADGTNFTWM